VIFGGFLVILGVIEFRTRAQARGQRQRQVPATPRAQTSRENDVLTSKIKFNRLDRKGSPKVAKTLLDGYWYDRMTDAGTLWEEIECIDRVAGHRLRAAANAYAAGFMPQPADVGRVIDDLLYRRQAILDLIICLRWEDTFTRVEQDTYAWYMAKIARKRCDRFVG
jgi:hypothetical protein